MVMSVPVHVDLITQKTNDDEEQKETQRAKRTNYRCVGDENLHNYLANMLLTMIISQQYRLMKKWARAVVQLPMLHVAPMCQNGAMGKTTRLASSERKIL